MSSPFGPFRTWEPRRLFLIPVWHAPELKRQLQFSDLKVLLSSPILSAKVQEIPPRILTSGRSCLSEDWRKDLSERGSDTPMHRGFPKMIRPSFFSPPGHPELRKGSCLLIATSLPALSDQVRLYRRACPGGFSRSPCPGACQRSVSVDCRSSFSRHGHRANDGRQCFWAGAVSCFRPLILRKSWN